MADIVIVPVLSDNYSYVVIDRVTRNAAVVDPVEPEKVLAAAKVANAKVVCVLTTHGHSDHAGGNRQMAALVPGINIYGGRGENAEAVTQEVWQGDSVKVGNLNIEVLATPCHTPGHVCYLIPAADGEPPAVFTGDTLFVAGCGHFNTGTPQQM